MASVLGFPNPVNEKAARTVAAGVLLMTVVALSTGWLWLTLPLAYGFTARALTGPTLSPLGQVAVRVVAPRLGSAKPVPGPPKRFAQAVGAVFTVSAAAAWALGASTVTMILLGVIIVFATLESVFGFCVGCLVFRWLMKIGVVPAETCLACAVSTTSTESVGSASS